MSNKVPNDWMAKLYKLLGTKYPGGRINHNKKTMDWIKEMYLSGITPEEASTRFQNIQF